MEFGRLKCNVEAHHELKLYQIKATIVFGDKEIDFQMEADDIKSIYNAISRAEAKGYSAGFFHSNLEQLR